MYHASETDEYIASKVFMRHRFVIGKKPFASCWI